MNYTLHQLRIFLKVTQTLNITRAAEELFLTQPAVSIQLKNFQSQFSIPVIEIVQKKIYVTEFGKEVAKAAEAILAEVQETFQKMDAHRGLLTGTLRISSVSTGKYIAPYFLSEFMKAHSGLDLVLDVTNKSTVVEALETNSVDFAFVSIVPKHLALNKVELMENKLYLVGKKQTDPRRKVYSPRFLETIPILFREPGSGTRYAMEQFFRRNRVTVRNKMELTSNEAVKQAVIAGLGYSIMPLIGIRNELKNGVLQIIPVKGMPIRSTWYLTWRKEKRMTPVATAYLDYLRNEKKNITQDTFGWTLKY